MDVDHSSLVQVQTGHFESHLHPVLAPSGLAQPKAAKEDLEKSINYIKVVLGKQEAAKHCRKHAVYMM